MEIGKQTLPSAGFTVFQPFQFKRNSLQNNMIGGGFLDVKAMLQLMLQDF